MPEPEVMEKSVSSEKMCGAEVEMRDRISGLPDSLLLHILSFLPARQAVTTSVLSKAWRTLWHSLTILDLDRRGFSRLKFFNQFVDKVLNTVDLETVKTFVLRYEHYKACEYYRAWKISQWINAVIVYDKVEYLEIDFQPKNDDYELPSTVFTANNIKVLKLNGVIMGTLSHVNLPLLEVLHLKSVKVPDVRSLEMLLSACALLKDLVLQILDVKFHAPLEIGKLNHLVTAEVPHSLLPLEALSNATSLRLHSPCPSLGLDVPTFYNLTYLEFKYDLHESKTIMKYLHSCPRLEILVIKKLFCRIWLKPTTIDIPLCVSLNLKEFHLGNYTGGNGEFKLARFIMKKAMVLRIISISRPSGSRVIWENIILKKISQCPISSVNCRLLLK